MRLSIGKKVMRFIVDTLLPDNCRRELHIAATKNSVTCLDITCMMRSNRDKIAHEIRHDNVHAA